MLLCSLSGWSSDLSVRVSRSEIRPGESFQLIIEARGRVEGYPDLTPLGRDFRIIARSQNSSVRVVNGKAHRRTALVLTLMPLHNGRLQIPVLSLGNEKTQPIDIKVSGAAVDHPADFSNKAIIEAMAQPRTPYAGQQVMLRVRVLSKDPWIRGSFSAPSISPAQTQVTPIGERRYTTLHKGQQHTALERVYALYPRVEGRLDIGPVTFTMPAGYGTQNEDASTLRSEPLSVEVKPAPIQTTSITFPPPATTPFSPNYNRAFQPPPLYQPYEKDEKAAEDRAVSAETTDLPVWIILLLVGGWMTALVVWLRYSRGVSFRLPLPPMPKVPDIALPRFSIRRRTIREVAVTYMARDAERARRALLKWAAVVWPENPPTNLTRTAERCSPELADAILLLEESFYGPVSRPWFDTPIDKMLRRFDPRHVAAGPTPHRRGLQPLNPSYSSNSP